MNNQHGNNDKMQQGQKGLAAVGFVSNKVKFEMIRLNAINEDTYFIDMFIYCMFASPATRRHNVFFTRMQLVYARYYATHYTGREWRDAVIRSVAELPQG